MSEEHPQGKKLEFQRKTSRRKGPEAPAVVNVVDPKMKGQRVGFFGGEGIIGVAGLTGNTLGVVRVMVGLFCFKNAKGHSRALIGIEFERRPQFEGIGWHFLWLRLGYSRLPGGEWERFKGI